MPYIPHSHLLEQLELKFEVDLSEPLKSFSPVVKILLAFSAGNDPIIQVHKARFVSDAQEEGLRQSRKLLGLQI
jgi:hypothetical protein